MVAQSQRRRVAAFQMNSLDEINVKSDSSFLLALEFQKRGYNIFFYEPDNLYIKNGAVIADGFFAIINSMIGAHYETTEQCSLDLKSVMLVMVRQDPPFDMNYITTTYILDLISNDTLILNRPSSIRSFAEKISPFLFHEFMPKSVFSKNLNALMDFCNQHPKVVLKPAYQHGGRDVTLIEHNKQSVIEDYIKRFGYVIAQEYIPSVERSGDKRIILIDGEILNYFRRIPVPGDFRSNTVLGGSYERCELSTDDLALCMRLKPFLKENGLFFVGIDVLDGKLLEINVTSPTGLAYINEIYQIQCEQVIIDKIEDMAFIQKLH